MKIPSLFVAFVLSAVSASASSLHHGAGVGHFARHNSLAQRAATSLEKKASINRKKCRPKTSTSAAASTTSAPQVAPSSAPAPQPSTTPPAAAKPAAEPAPNNNNNGGGGVLYKSGPCGESRATQQVTTTSGPNGALDWLNCGVESGGWNPPYIGIGELKTKSLSASISEPGSPFAACGQYVWLIEKYANQHGIPPILIASIAMQESSCNADTVGGGGEQGLMQITHEKCGGAPGGNCRDPEFNIATGVRFFSETLNRNNGNVVTTLGNYNGWPVGMTVQSATAARWSNCCKCQNNLDYLHQMLNGWCQGINSYDSGHRLGRYFNLDPCN